VISDFIRLGPISLGKFYPLPIMIWPAPSQRSANVHPFHRAKLLASAIAMFALAMPASAATNLVKNGGFELNGGPGVVSGNGGYYQQTTVNDWYFTFPTSTPLAGVDTYAHSMTNTSQAIQFWGAAPGYQNGNGFQASPTGGYFWASDGDPRYVVGLKQDISGLTIGEKYDLSFDFAFGQEACPGGWCIGATNQRWDIGFGSESYTTGGNVVQEHGFVGWLTSAHTFTATATTQTLQFWANGPGGQPPVALLDSVKLTAQNEPLAATPGPLPLLGFGVSLAWSGRLRKRIKQSNSR
jgi:hypothetical protein